jgi:hypothetical protein
MMIENIVYLASNAKAIIPDTKAVAPDVPPNFE